MSQPNPVGNDGPRIADLVTDDIRERLRRGVREYGRALQAMNGRRALQDLYEELLDGAHYVRQRIQEEDQALGEVVGDPEVRYALSDIFTRTEQVRKRPNGMNRDALARAYVDDVAYCRMVIEALVVQQAKQSVPPPPPQGTEVARYQYRGVGPGAWVDYDDESYDQDYINEWCADPSTWTEGYYPEYRPLYGGQWYRVDPENPPEQPESSGYVPQAPDTPEDDEKPS